MKSIYLLRHAKAEKIPDSNKIKNDIARPLSERGRTDSHIIGKQLQKMKIQFDFICCSSSKRTQETLSIIKEYLELSLNKIEIDPNLYLCEPYYYYEKIKELPEKFNSVCFIGHNETITIVSNTLAKQFVTEKVPTAGLVQINLNSWKPLNYKSAEIAYFIYPKMFY